MQENPGTRCMFYAKVHVLIPQFSDITPYFIEVFCTTEGLEAQNRALPQGRNHPLWGEMLGSLRTWSQCWWQTAVVRNSTKGGLVLAKTPSGLIMLCSPIVSTGTTASDSAVMVTG